MRVRGEAFAPVNGMDPAWHPIPSRRPAGVSLDERVDRSTRAIGMAVELLLCTVKQVTVALATDPEPAPFTPRDGKTKILVPVRVDTY